MELTRMRKAVRSVTRLQTDKNGVVTSATRLYETDKPNKKQRKGVKEVGKGVRKAHSAVQTIGEEYIARHNRSNRKKRDGWAKDLPTNMVKAARKGAKKVKPSKFI
jgi:hypothetical protein